MKEYPFNDFNDMWPYVSQMDVGFSLDRLHSSVLIAKKEAVKIIGGMYNEINDHFWSDNYNQEGETDETRIALNKLVPILQGMMANFTVYDNYIWMVMKVSTEGISQRSGDEYKPVSQSMSIEAKNSLLNAAWLYSNDLIDTLDSKKDLFTTWTEFIANQPQLILFKKASEFDKYFTIDNSSYFFSFLKQLLFEIETENVKSRFKVDDLTTLNDDILYNLRKAVAYDAMSEAVFRFDYHLLPAPIRQDIDKVAANKHYARSVTSADTNSTFIKEKLKNAFAEKAENYYAKASSLRHEDTSEDAATEDYVPPTDLPYNDEDDPVVFT